MQKHHSSSVLVVAFVAFAIAASGAFVSAFGEPSSADTTRSVTGRLQPPEVITRALAYALPESGCLPPRYPRRGNAVQFVEADNRAKLHSYIECLNARSAALKVDFEFLRNSVGSGVTQAQADVIGGHMRAVYLELHQLQALAKQADDNEAEAAATNVYRNPELMR